MVYFSMGNSATKRTVVEFCQLRYFVESLVYTVSEPHRLLGFFIQFGILIVERIPGGIHAKAAFSGNWAEGRETLDARIGITVALS